MSWPSEVRIGNQTFTYVYRDTGVYYECDGYGRNDEVHISIHEPGGGLLDWMRSSGLYSSKAHATRNKFITLKFNRGHVSYPRQWSANPSFRLDTDPDNAGEWQAQYDRAKLLGVLFWDRIQHKWREAMEAYVSQQSGSL